MFHSNPSPYQPFSNPSPAPPPAPSPAQGSANPSVSEFGPPRGYLVFLWSVLAWVQAGLIFLWNIPWYRHEMADARSWLVWLAFDALLLVGTIHATLFRARVDETSLEYLAWTFRWTHWDWEEITRLERRSNMLGARYRVLSERGAFPFTAVGVQGAAVLAHLIVERADLDDMGEDTMSLQAGTLHVWQHPSADDYE